MQKQPSLVTIGNSGRDPLPWVMIWKTPTHLVWRWFQTRDAAVEAARDVCMGYAPFDIDTAVYPAKSAYYTELPTPEAIDEWIEAADDLLFSVLEDRGC